jgi:ADP-ribose pyrophosphatase
LTLYTRKHTVGSRRVFDGQLISVRVDDVKADGKAATREVVEHPGGVVIACKPSADEIVLIRQYRYSVDLELIELPAGRLETGEDKLVAAKRELTEETGFQAAHWEKGGVLYPAVGFCEEVLTWYIATDVRWVGGTMDEDEEIEVMRVSLPDAWKLVLDGTITDAKTVAILGIICRA